MASAGSEIVMVITILSKVSANAHHTCGKVVAVICGRMCFKISDNGDPIVFIGHIKNTGTAAVIVCSYLVAAFDFQLAAVYLYDTARLGQVAFYCQGVSVQVEGIT